MALNVISLSNISETIFALSVFCEALTIQFICYKRGARHQFYKIVKRRPPREYSRASLLSRAMYSMFISSSWRTCLAMPIRDFAESDSASTRCFSLFKKWSSRHTIMGIIHHLKTRLFEYLTLYLPAWQVNGIQSAAMKTWYLCHEVILYLLCFASEDIFIRRVSMKSRHTTPRRIITPRRSHNKSAASK